MKTQSHRTTFTIATLFAAFVLLAMPDALRSVGWPDMRDEFGLRQDSIGWLLAMSTIGHLVSGFLNGQMLNRFGAKKLLRSALIVLALSLIGVWLAPSWPLLVLFSLVTGWAQGAIDAGANTIVAARYNERIMNWLHGFFGVGATLGPLVISGVVAIGWSSWRGGAVVFGGLIFVLLVITAGLSTIEDVGAVSAESDAIDEMNAAPSAQTLSMTIVWIAILFFFVYGGIEVAIGQWAFTLLTESRGITEQAARVWVSVYWGTFTFGRFLFGTISHWLPAKTWLRGCVIVTALAVVLLLFPGSRVLGLTALALSGIAQAPIFATLVSMMPKLVGQRHAPNAIGYVVGAAGIGVAFLPSVGGVLAERISLEAIPPFILVLTLIQIVLFEQLMRHRPSNT